MAKVGEEEVEYESDPEEENRLMVRRRREAASDDEEGEGVRKERVDRRGPIDSDESDGQGGAAEYDDEGELDGEEDDGVYDDDEEVYDEEEREEEGVDGFEAGKEGIQEGGGVGFGGRGIGDKEGTEADGRQPVEEQEEGEGEEEKEPFAVPTAGAFYMHDDRFRDNAGGRHRRTHGGRRLWESKDNKKWGHDKYEEMTSHERHYGQGGRTSKGLYRARGGKNRGPDRGYGERNRSRVFSNGNNQIQVPKTVRGRGPRRYDPTMKNSSHTLPTQKKHSGKPPEKTSHSSSGRVFTPASNAECDQVPPAKKHSGLSSASPPFYPSGSSNNDVPLAQKSDVQAGSESRNLRTPVLDESFPRHQHSSLMRGKNMADSVGIDKLYIDDSVSSATGKPLNNMQMPPGSSLVNTMQSSQSRVQGKAVALSGQMTYQQMPPNKQVSRVPSSTQLHGVQQSPAQNWVQPSVQAPPKQLSQRSASGSQASPPKTPLSTNSYDTGELESASESSKSKTALVAKGKGGIQGTGRGPFLYGGAGATGNTTVGPGDQNFPATPTFLPVMQFRGQPHGGMGVPAVGMAFPGYVAQPQLGLGNSEMTWLPVLAGAAGALGATYRSPYVALDGAYHAQSSGQASSMGSSSKETNTNKLNNEWKPSSQRPELVSDEFGQRQKPRRYSEMDFKQPSTSS